MFLASCALGKVGPEAMNRMYKPRAVLHTLTGGVLYRKQEVRNEPCQSINQSIIKVKNN